MGNGEVIGLHIPCGLLIPELGLRGEIWGLQCRLRAEGEHGRYQRVFSGAETRSHFIGLDRYNSWEEFYGKSLGMRALVVIQSSLDALSLYQAARKDVVVISVGKNISAPIDPIILRLGERMSVLLADHDECKGKE